MKTLTIVILTYNEEIHIERCIRSLQPIANKIYIVDSFSSDRTVEIARSLGAEVEQRKWKNYADQFQWGLEHCGAGADSWIMRMDADEYLEPDLQRELQELLPNLPDDVDGIYLKRKVFFYRKWIRYGGVYPLVLLRIWRAGKGRIEQRWMDEHVVLLPGARTIAFEMNLVDDNRKGISFWISKHNQYASREAVDLLNQKYALLKHDDALMAIDDPQAKRKRLIKEKVYSRLPVGIRAFFYFCYRYFLRWGFLDGRQGFIWDFMQGCWYGWGVDIKVMEIEERAHGDVEKMRQILREEHGITI